MTQEWFIAELGGERYGLPLSQVDEVVRATRVLRVPQAPPALAGALVVRGEAIPVLDLRARLGAAAAAIHPRQFFVLGTVSGGRAAIVMDAVEGLASLVVDVTTEASLPRPAYATGVATDDQGRSIMLVDLSLVLSSAEATQISQVMARRGDPSAQD